MNLTEYVIIRAENTDRCVQLTWETMMKCTQLEWKTACKSCANPARSCQ